MTLNILYAYFDQGYLASCVIWHGILGYKETSCIKMCSKVANASWICGNTGWDKVRNEDIVAKIGIVSI